MNWKLVYTRQAQKDAEKLSRAGFKEKAKAILDLLSADPFRTPPRYEKLVGDLSGAYSRRITIQHRIVYHVLDNEKVVKILRLCGHYE